VRCDAHSAVENLQGLPRQVRFYLLVYQRVRDAVIVPLDFNVIVDVDFGRLPLSKPVARGRQRFQRRLVELREQAGAVAFTLAERPPVEPHQQLGNSLVDLIEGEELAFAQGRDDPAILAMAVFALVRLETSAAAAKKYFCDTCPAPGIDSRASTPLRAVDMSSRPRGASFGRELRANRYRTRTARRAR